MLDCKKIIFTKACRNLRQVVQLMTKYIVLKLNKVNSFKVLKNINYGFEDFWSNTYFLYGIFKGSSFSLNLDVYKSWHTT